MRVIDMNQELTDVFSESTAKTVGPITDWPRFWKLFDTAQIDDRRMRNLHIADWLLSNMAFGDGGVRMVAR